MKNTILTLAAIGLIAPVAMAEPGDYQCPEEAAKCAHMMAEHLGQRGWVGINMDGDKESGPVVITNVIEGSPGERAGLEKGDILRGLNGVAYTGENEEKLRQEYEAFSPGKKATFSVERDGKTFDITVTLESIPKAILAQWIGNHILEAHQVAATETDAEPEADSP